MTDKSLAKINGTEIAKIIPQSGITELIKPLVKEIELYETFISGTLEINEDIIKELSVDQKLIMRKGVDPRFGDDEITLFTEAENQTDQKRIGYIPEDEAIFLGRLMDAGKLLTAKILDIKYSSEVPLVKIEIYLVDY